MKCLHKQVICGTFYINDDLKQAAAISQLLLNSALHYAVWGV